MKSCERIFLARARNSHPNAFTLTELLVILALLLLLVAFLLPTLSNATERGRRVRCRNNLKQFGLTLQMYASENRNMLPSGIRDNGDQDLAFISSHMRTSLVYYASGTDKFLVCPNMDMPRAWGTNGGLYTPGVGYSIGYLYIGGHTDTPWSAYGGNPGWISPLKLSDHPGLAVVADMSSWCPAQNWTLVPHGLRGPNILGSPINTRKGGMPVKSAGISGCNLLYLDGSARWKPGSQMREYISSGFGDSYLCAW